MTAEAPLKIPTEFLPKDWRENASKQFKLAVSTIEKTAYGKRKNLDVFDYLLQLAEAGKADAVARQERLKALTA